MVRGEMGHVTTPRRECAEHIREIIKNWLTKVNEAFTRWKRRLLVFGKNQRAHDTPFRITGAQIWPERENTKPATDIWRVSAGWTEFGGGLAISFHNIPKLSI